MNGNAGNDPPPDPAHVLGPPDPGWTAAPAAPAAGAAGGRPPLPPGTPWLAVVGAVAMLLFFDVLGSGDAPAGDDAPSPSPTTRANYDDESPRALPTTQYGDPCRMRTAAKGRQYVDLELESRAYAWALLYADDEIRRKLGAERAAQFRYTNRYPENPGQLGDGPRDRSIGYVEEGRCSLFFDFHALEQRAQRHPLPYRVIVTVEERASPRGSWALDSMVVNRMSEFQAQRGTTPVASRRVIDVQNGRPPPAGWEPRARKLYALDQPERKLRGEQIRDALRCPDPEFQKALRSALNHEARQRIEMDAYPLPVRYPWLEPFHIDYNENKPCWFTYTRHVEVTNVFGVKLKKRVELRLRYAGRVAGVNPVSLDSYRWTESDCATCSLAPIRVPQAPAGSATTPRAPRSGTHAREAQP